MGESWGGFPRVGISDSRWGLGKEASFHDETPFDGYPGTRDGALDAGETVRAIAEALSVAPSSVVKWSQRRRRTGSAAPGKIGGHVPRKIRGAEADWLRARMAEGNFTRRGLVAELAERGLKVDYRTMWAFVHAEGLSFKKTALTSEQERPDIARKRARWKARQGSIDPRRLVFIDGEPANAIGSREQANGAKTNMAPARAAGGRAARG